MMLRDLLRRPTSSHLSLTDTDDNLWSEQMDPHQFQYDGDTSVATADVLEPGDLIDYQYVLANRLWSHLY